jgi:hypothetical protein
MALQYLALSSQCVEGDWAAAVGVRDVAAGMGVTKDTAARALSSLAIVGLVERHQVTTPSGRRRSGYFIHLPESMSLVDHPGDLVGLETARLSEPARVVTTAADIR